MDSKKWVWILVFLAIAVGCRIVVGSYHKQEPYMLPVRVRVILVAQASQTQPGIAYNPDAVRRILKNRLDAFGITHATVEQIGQDTFIVQMPEVKNMDAILELLCKTALLTSYYFKVVACQHDRNLPIEIAVARDNTYLFFDRRTGRSFHDMAYIDSQFRAIFGHGSQIRSGAQASLLPTQVSSDMAAGRRVAFTPDQQQQTLELNQELKDWNAFIHDCPIVMTGADIEPHSVGVMGGPLGNMPAIALTFTASGAEKINTFTKAHIDEIEGIVFDGKVLSAPTMREPIIGRSVEMYGCFKSLKEAQDLAALLNAGALPLPIRVEAERIESPSGT